MIAIVIVKSIMNKSNRETNIKNGFQKEFFLIILSLYGTPHSPP